MPGVVGGRRRPWYSIAMATLNKTSVREEVGRLKQEFDQLCSDGKVSPEMRAVMSSLLVVVDLILAIFLEKTTRKNNKNSSLPSSQTDKDERQRHMALKQGKAGSFLARSATRE